MKRRLLVFTSVLTVISCATFMLKAQTNQQEKEATVKFTRGELEALYPIIDDAAVPGQIRRPLLLKIEVAYRSAFSQPAPQPKDTTKPKRN